MGPEPMMSTLRMVGSLGIGPTRFYHRYKAVYHALCVRRTWVRLRVPLYPPNRPLFVSDPFHTSIVEVGVCHLVISRHGAGLNHVAVVLGGHGHFPGNRIKHR